MILEEIKENMKIAKDKICYYEDGKEYTYKTMYKYICNMNEFLKNNNPNKIPIMVYGNKKVYMKVAFLAAAFAGIPYIPIDETMPKKRVDSIIEQTSPKIIIGNYKSSKTENISINEIENIINKEKYKEIEKIEMKEDDIFYIIFTSGSTGEPKGVEITYSNLDSCINWLKKEANLRNDIILNQASFSFDLSVADLYLSLLNSSSQYILKKAMNQNLKEMYHDLQKSNATMAVFTPSFIEMLLIDKSFNEKLMPNLKKIIFCGEKLSNKTVSKLFERFEKLDIINCYGPTECTFAVTSFHIVNKESIPEEIPIGYPKDDIRILIQNNKQKEYKEKEIGEIIILGKSVAKGYVKNKTNKSFVEINGEKAYKTGDLGYIKNNVYYYYGRKDSQVKYKGYRIELKDIEKICIK